MLAKALTWMIRAFLGLTALYEIAIGNFTSSLLFFIAFFVSLIPIVIERHYGIKLHWIFKFEVALVVLWHMIGFFGAYQMFPWWDDVGHINGGALVALITFAWLWTMHSTKRIKLPLSLISLVTIAWGTLIGVLWEVMEFTWDSSNMVGAYGYAQNGLVDTMTDISNDMLAAVVVVVICVMLVSYARKRGRNPFVG